MNTTLEGLAVKDRLEGSPDVIEDQQDDDDDDDGDGGDGKPKNVKKTNMAENQEEEFDRMMKELDDKLKKESEDKVEVVGEPPLPPPDGEPPYDGPEHHSMGKAGDGIIYLSDIGKHVKLDRRGRPYRVGPDGRKEVRGSPRPKSSYSPEEWRALSAKERDVIIRRGKLDAEAEKLKEIKLLYDGHPMTIRVMNALVRLVHGGRGMEDSKQLKDPKKFNKAFAELLQSRNPTKTKKNVKKVASATKCGHDEVQVHDEWKWIGNHTLERIHNIPRRDMFVPSDCEDCPCDHRLIQDWRETQQKFQSNVRVVKDNWRLLTTMGRGRTEGMSFGLGSLSSVS